MELLCKICHAKFASAEGFLLHFDFTHRVSAKSRFICGVDSCCLQFLSKDRFQSHLLQFHHSSCHSSNSSPNNDSSQISCPIENCNFTCNAKSSLRVHRKRKHGQNVCGDDGGGGSSTINNSLAEVVTETVHALPSNSNVEYCFDGTDDTLPGSLIFPPEVEADTGRVLKDEIVKKIVHFYMSLNSKYHVPDSTIQYMVDSLYSIAKESNKIVKDDILCGLRKAGIEINQQIEYIVTDVLSKLTLLEVHSPEGPLRSRYMRLKTYRSGLFTYIAPKPLKLGLNRENEVRKYHIVPIKNTVEEMFKDDSVFEQYVKTQSRSSQDELIRDIYDGSLLRNHPVLSKDKSAVGIMLDADDLEIASPLGAAKGQHKTTSAYFTLTNLQPWSRMKKDIIKLCMVIAEKDVAYFGLEKVLEPLIRELADLAENGIEIRGQRVKAVLVMLLGDNLGTHTWTGLVENFSHAKYFCRYCEESRVEWRIRWKGSEVDEEDSDSEAESSDSEDSSDSEQELESENEEAANNDVTPYGCMDLGPWADVPTNSARMRSRESYEECLAELKKKQPVCDKAKGVVGFCELNKLKDFHWVGACPPCIAHDLFEGVLAYDTALALKYFHKNFGIDANYINSKLRHLKLLGCDQGCKPAKVVDGMKKLRGGAVQNWNFLRFLPFLVGNKINTNDKVWQMLMLLSQVTRVLTSPAICRSTLPELKHKIHLYLKMRCCLFPNVPLRPKHHFFEHYPSLIEIFGCLMRVNTLGCESKHRFLKNTAQAKKNFKNITKLLSEEHQLAQSAITVESVTCNAPVLEDATLPSLANMSPAMSQTAVSYFGMEELESLACSDKVRFHGTWYRKGEILVIHEPNMQLCLIEHIFVSGENCYAGGLLCKGVLNQWQLIEVAKTPECTVVNLARLNDYLSYPLYQTRGANVIVLKHSTQFLQ